MTTVPFHDQAGEVFIVIGTGKNVTLAPRTSACGFLRVYRMVDDGRALELVHKVCAVPMRSTAAGPRKRMADARPVLGSPHARHLDPNRRVADGAVRFPGQAPRGHGPHSAHLRSWQEEAAAQMREQGAGGPGN